jgi:hypothetical protein
MRIAVAVIACLAVAGMSGCVHEKSCGVADHGGGGTGYQTAQQALNSVLAQHDQGLSATGWVAKDKSAGGETFTSGNDSVDVVKTPTGKWVVAAVTTCS